jgi:hypothetical protein
MANTIIYAEDWAVKLQERLSEPTKWKEFMNVEYTNTRVLHNPYLSDATVQTGTRGTAYTMQDATETDESITISTYKILPQVIDRADLAQSTYSTQMVLADRQGILLNEAIESAIYANHAALTNFGDTGGGVLGLGATTIGVSATNIDDIIRGIKREVNKAKGQVLASRNGIFIVWRPADMEILESFMQANGFMSSDRALNGNSSLDSTFTSTAGGVNYMGVTNYASNLLTANHVLAGVKKVYQIGIVKDTYGQVVVTQDPLNVSGIGVISRVDYGVKAWNNVLPVLFDVNVA